MGLERVESMVLWIQMESEKAESLDWLTNLGSLKVEKMAVWTTMVPGWE